MQSSSQKSSHHVFGTIFRSLTFLGHDSKNDSTNCHNLCTDWSPTYGRKFEMSLLGWHTLLVLCLPPFSFFLLGPQYLAQLAVISYTVAVCHPSQIGAAYCSNVSRNMRVTYYTVCLLLLLLRLRPQAHQARVAALLYQMRTYASCTWRCGPGSIKVGQPITCIVFRS